MQFVEGWLSSENHLENLKLTKLMSANVFKQAAQGLRKYGVLMRNNMGMLHSDSQSFLCVA